MCQCEHEKQGKFSQMVHVEENAKHIIMQCPAYADIREKMSTLIKNVSNIFDSFLLEFEVFVYVFAMVLGRCPDGYLILIYSDMEPVWMVAGILIDRMYSDCLVARQGVEYHKFSVIWDAFFRLRVAHFFPKISNKQ